MAFLYASLSSVAIAETPTDSIIAKKVTTLDGLSLVIETHFVFGSDTTNQPFEGLGSYTYELLYQQTKHLLVLIYNPTEFGCVVRTKWSGSGMNRPCPGKITRLATIDTDLGKELSVDLMEYNHSFTEDYFLLNGILKRKAFSLTAEQKF